MKKLKKFLSHDLTIATLLFLLAAFVRTIPEIKAGIWPIGYDTFNTYAPQLATYNGSLINWLKTANLIYFIFLPFKLAGIDPGFLMKIFGPIFFGALTVSFYFWSRYFVGFNKLKSFLASALIIFQLATLRMSWDLYRNELGLIFLFLALIYLPQIAKRKALVLFSLFGLLVVLSHELVAVILLVILVIYGFSLLFQKKYPELLRISFPTVLVSLIFVVVLFSARQNLYHPNVIFTSESNNIFWHYFYQYQKDMPYQKLFKTISQLFRLFYQFLLPFALYGFWFLRKKLILSTITLWLLIGTFSSLIFSGTGIIVWERWLIMLAFPFAIYAVEGIFKLGRILGKFKNWAKHLKFLARGLATIFWLGFFGLFIFRALPFLIKDYPDAKPPLANDRLNNYFPRTMVHNSVGIWKIENTLNAIKWLDKNTPSGAVVLVDNRYRGLMLTHFEMDNRYIISNNWSDNWPKSSFAFAKKKGFKDIYLIWPVMPIRGFDKVYSSDNLNVYKAKPF